jgi:DNA-binding protein YbaB
MADEKSKDPAQMFQEWVTQWERATDSFSNRMMGNDDFSKYMNQMQSVQMEFQKGFAELMAGQLAKVNMPSREDVLQISEDIQSLDRRMARIETSLHQLTQTSDTSSGRTVKKTPRTKKSPASKKSTPKKSTSDKNE